MIAESSFEVEFGPLIDRIRAWRVADIMDTAHRHASIATICHGDVWVNNLLFAADGQPRAMLLDWQFTSWGNPLIDIAFLLDCSLETELRREHTSRFVEQYFDGLMSHSAGRLSYSMAECRRDFELAAEFGAIMTIANLEACLAGFPPGFGWIIARRMAAVMVDLFE